MNDKCIVIDSIVTVGASDLMLKDIINNVTSADWKSFSQQSSSSNSLVPFPVSPLSTGDLLWSFLEGKDCHITLENNSCVHLKTFSVTSIRNVVLVLHRPYNKHIPANTLFCVERFSGTAGSVINGKGLIGHFEILFKSDDVRSEDMQRWNPEGVKISHTHFVIVDQESPDGCVIIATVERETVIDC